MTLYIPYINLLRIVLLMLWSMIHIVFFKNVYYNTLRQLIII